MKDSKNVYEILNYIDIDSEEYGREALNDMEKQGLKSVFRRNVKREASFRKFRTVAAVAAIMVMTLGFLSGTSFGKNVYGAAQSKIAEISYSIGKALGTEKDIEPYVNVVNQVVEVNGVEVKLSEVIIDKDELIFSLITDTNKVVDGIRFNWDIFINGKRLKNYGVAGSSGKMGDSETVFSEIYLVEAKGIELNENLDIKIVLKELNYLTGTSEEKIKGRWEFEFTANGSELMANSYAQAVGYSFDIGEQSYTLEEFRCNPVNQKITGKKITDKSQASPRASYDIELRGHDNLGNEVVFYLASVSGEDLMFRNSRGLSEGDLLDEITWIALTPYAVKFPEESGKMSNDYKQVGEEFTIVLSK
jgi:hypothetical protein